MATKVYMEALSPTMEEGRLITWLKNEGDQIAEGDVLAEVETDKATMELVARGEGVLRKRLLDEGATASVGVIIGVIAGPDEDVSGIGGNGAGAAPAEAKAPPAEGDAKEARDKGAAEELSGQAAEQQGAAPAAEAPEAEKEPPAGGGTGDGRKKASPLARRLAQEGGLTLEGVEGSGPGGRIIKRDIEAALETAPAARAAGAPPAAAGVGGFTEVPLSQMRKTIAKRLTQSIGPVPHFFLTIEVDMTRAMELRKRINDSFADKGVKVSPNDLVIKSVAMALLQHPWVNAAWTGESIRLYESVHIGVAVAVDEGLITPVIRDAHRKGITQISTEVKELAGRAREKKLKPDEYTGSTFSISNLGMFGIEEFTAVINPPEAAILAVGAAAEKVVVENGEMVVRSRMRVTLSCDHRVVDGATGAQFLQTLKRYLEDPMMMIA
jgi:pyruvate dehydrogenase E2 component (dihydrolipoamide acetyltransferase)